MPAVIIAEKPSVAADIANVLGANTKKDSHWENKDIIVTWAIGHLLELKTHDDYDKDFKNWRGTVDRLPFIPEEFELKPIAGRNSNKKQLTSIKKLITSKDCTEIVNACDAAREGELIFRRIVEYSKTKAPMSRMWLQSMTDSSIQSAWDERKSATEYQNLRDAAISRAEADWIIGMNGSRIAATFLRTNRNDKKSLSLGRVQTATLAIIVDREIEILSHDAKPFWQLNAEFSAGDAKWDARWERAKHKDDPDNPEHKAHRIVDPEEKKILEEVLASPGVFSVSQTNRDKTEKAPLNFDLTSLQSEANKMWSWSAKRTLGVAQELYATHKLTTYPRTDSRFLPEDMMEEISKTIKKLGAQDLLNEHSQRLINDGLSNSSRNFNNAKVADHFAIIPTGKIPQDNLSVDASRLYELISRQFLASFHPAASWEVQRRIATKNDQSFSKEGERLVEAGWRLVRPKKSNLPDGWSELPNNPCDAKLESHEFKEEMTKPTGRLKEAGLLRLMEHAGKKIDDEKLASAMKGKGLGTPATRADTIEKLISREFINRGKGGSIRATPHGIKLIEILRRIPVEWITSPELTGDMESKLLDVQKGSYLRSNYMQEIGKLVQELVDKIRDHDRSILFENDESVGKCPLCDSPINETILSYICKSNEGRDKGCDFILWKDAGGRWFDRNTTSRFIMNQEITNLHGFFNRNDEHFSTSINLENGNMKFAGSNAQTSESTDEELCSCPKCEHGVIRVGNTTYACDNDECRFRGVGKNICKREISPEEAKKILQEGKSDLIDDFTSRAGRPFAAYLLVEGNKVGFEFPPREPPADMTRFEVVEGVLGKCQKHDVGIIESSTHYVAEANDKGCKIQIPRELSKRAISREEATELVEKKKIGPFEDFISRKAGKPFTATLYIKGNESIGYRFTKR